MRTLFIVLLSILIIYILFVAVLFMIGKRSIARAIGGFVPDCIMFIRNIIQSKSLPKRDLLILGVVVAYLVFPFDFIPDFIPLVGQIDDAIIVALALRFILKKLGKEKAAKNWPGPENSLNALLKLTKIP